MEPCRKEYWKEHSGSSPFLVWFALQSLHALHGQQHDQLTHDGEKQASERDHAQTRHPDGQPIRSNRSQVWEAATGELFRASGLLVSTLPSGVRLAG